MNIHEIIQAWDNVALPTDLDVLAAMQNKVDDYAQKAVQGSEKAKSQLVFELYNSQAVFYQELSRGIERHIADCIPDIGAKKTSSQL